jgi:hypothetical protein
MSAIRFASSASTPNSRARAATVSDADWRTDVEEMSEHRSADVDRAARMTHVAELARHL